MPTGIEPVAPFLKGGPPSGTISAFGVYQRLYMTDGRLELPAMLLARPSKLCHRYSGACPVPSVMTLWEWKRLACFIHALWKLCMLYGHFTNPAVKRGKHASYRRANNAMDC